MLWRRHHLYFLCIAVGMARYGPTRLAGLASARIFSLSALPVARQLVSHPLALGIQYGDKTDSLISCG